MLRIVVGIDGSTGSRIALDRAVEHARCRAAEIDAIWVWHRSYGVIEPAPSIIVTPTEIESAAERDLDAIVAAAGATDLVVNQIVAEGDPARILLDAAKGADLLVVGTRGHGGIVGLVLGSVSYKCITRATCPVLVVPEGTAS